MARIIKSLIYYVLTAKPVIRLKSTYTFRKGMVINCTLANSKQVCPPEVKYTWFSCDNGKCDEASALFKIESYSLRLTELSRFDIMYRCIAKNTAGSDYKTIEVLEEKSKSKTFSQLEIDLCDRHAANPSARIYFYLNIQQLFYELDSYMS